MDESSIEPIISISLLAWAPISEKRPKPTPTNHSPKDQLKQNRLFQPKFPFKPAQSLQIQQTLPYGPTLLYPRDSHHMPPPTFPAPINIKPTHKE